MINSTLDYLYNLKRLGIKFGLETTIESLKLLGDPHKKIKTIHVAGTNGKGSVTAMLSSILQNTGYKVGTYISPHLIKFNERISINNKEISDEEILQLTKLIKNKIENLNPTFFEFTTAMAFYYFNKKEVDFAIIEVGCGGRLDSTNVINPLMSVITNISIDHTDLLGKTPLKIAEEKAGIIKNNGLVVTAEKNKKILELFKKICKERNSKLYILNEKLNYVENISDLNKQHFLTKGIVNSEFEIPLLGEHQIDNALTAILTIKLLKKYNISLNNIKQGLKKTKWPGRLQIISKNPLIILDGAHDVAAFKKLKKFITQLPNKKILILGISKDKQIKQMASIIAPLVDEIIITKANFKPASMSLLEKEIINYNKNIKKISNVKDAILEAASSTKEDDLILVTGSLYLVGDVMINRKFFTKLRHIIS